MNKVFSTVLIAFLLGLVYAIGYPFWGGLFSHEADVIAEFELVFWLVILSVQESAWSRCSSLLRLGRIVLFLKKPTFPTENWTVLVARFVLPSLMKTLGLVYSPTRSK